MLRKTIPFILMSGLVLGACGTKEAVPKNNETPMEDMNNREENWAPDVRDERRGGPEIDGLETAPNGNNGVRDGVINDNNLNNDDGNMLKDENTPDQRNDDLNNR